MATAALDNDTSVEDFGDESTKPDQDLDQDLDLSTETGEKTTDTAVEPQDDIGSEYDLGDDEQEQTVDTPAPEQSGESNPSAKAGDTATEPADSGVVDGESFPPELLQLANMDEARAKAAFGTPQALENALVQHFAQTGRNAALAQQQQLLQKGQPQSPSSKETQESAAPTQEEIVEYLKLKLELPEEFAEVEDNKLLFDALSNQLGQQISPHFQRLEQQNQQLLQRLQYFEQREQAEAWERHDDEFDRFISELPEEWHELLGKERPEIGTPQHQARAQLFHAKSMLERGTKQLGQELPLQRALELGLRTAFPNHHDTIVKKSVTTQRKNGPVRIARPNNRKSAPPSGDQAGIQNLKSRMKELGTAEPTAGVSEDDFLG